MQTPLNISKLHITSPAPSPSPIDSSKKRPRESEPSCDREKMARIEKIIKESCLTKPLKEEEENLIIKIPEIFTRAAAESAAKSSAALPESSFASPPGSPEKTSKTLYPSPLIKAADLFETLIQRASDTSNKGKPVASPYTQNKRTRDILNSSLWGNETSANLLEILPSPLKPLPKLINMDHILNPDRKGGFHFNQTSDKRWASMQEIRQSPTGVVSGYYFEKNGSLKQSSFYPPETFSNERELFNSLTKVRKTPFKKSSKKEILLTQAPGNNFPTEGYRKRSLPHEWSSIYPIFLNIPKEALEKPDPIQITTECNLGGKFSPAVFLPPEVVKDAVRKKLLSQTASDSSHEKASPKGIADLSFDEPSSSAISYQHREENVLLVDIAPELSVGVPRGIFVEVSSSEIDSLKKSK